jgi:hypothetical protein
MKLQKTIKANLSNGLSPLIIMRRMFAFASFRNRHRGIYKLAGKTILRSVFFILCCACFLPSEAQAATITVKTTSDTIVSNACLNSSPGCSLRGAITLAESTFGNDLINFNIPATDAFCTNGACIINLTSPLPTISTNITIVGPGADKLTVRHTANFDSAVFRVVSVPGGLSVSFFDLTISNGNSSQPNGGGISAAGSSSDLTVSVIRCVISGNTAANGGGIYNTADMLIRDSLINGNTGGGIFNSAGVMKIINSTITSNTGTGVFNSLGILSLTNSTVSSNAGLNGIGITNLGNTAIFNVKSSIIARNGGAFFSDINGAFVSWGFNLVGKRDAGTGFSETTDLTGTIDAPLDPKFDPGGLKDNGGTTKTITLMSGSPAIDKGSSNGLAGVLSSDQRFSPRLFDDPAVQNASGGDGTDIGALERRKSPYDFDGDGRTDVGVFRPADGSWWYVRSVDSQFRVFSFGTGADVVTPGDFTGDGRADIAVFRPSNGTWYIQRSEDNSFFSFPFGLAGDIPVPADYDRDGKTDAAVFRPGSGTWFILNSGGSGTSIVNFGTSGDKPVAADYDSDGRADIAIFRPADGSWWYLRSSDGQFRVFRFGLGTDKPVQGDYTGDGKAELAVFRPSTGEWFFQRSEDNSYYSVPFGAAGDVVAPGDYDGDGKFDTAVFRPSTANWFVQRSSAGILITSFGASGDRPIPNAFVP